jgi:hypothetical protein
MAKKMGTDRRTGGRIGLMNSIEQFFSKITEISKTWFHVLLLLVFSMLIFFACPSTGDFDLPN